MKTIILILLASIAALMAIAGLAEPAVTISEAALSPKPAAASVRREWKTIAGGPAILAPRFRPAAAADEPIVLASLPDRAHETVSISVLPPSSAEARSHAFPSDIPVPAGLLTLPLSTTVLSRVVPPPSGAIPLEARDAKASEVPEAKMAALPAKAEPDAPAQPPAALPAKAAPASPAKATPEIARWSPPLVDRVLTASERAELLSADLQNAIFRMEPIFDPTRVGGAVEPVPLRVSAGSASMSNVFGERWHLASDDVDVDAKVASIGLAWRAPAVRSCESFVVRRLHDAGQPNLDALSTGACGRVLARLSNRFDDAAPLPVLAAAVDLPAFAAPMPGARMSSQQFWAAQKAHVEAIEARLRDKRFALQPHAMAGNVGP